MGQKNLALAEACKAVRESGSESFGSADSDSYRWFVVIMRAEEYRHRTGRGLARLWGRINADDLEGAERVIGEINAGISRGEVQV